MGGKKEKKKKKKEEKRLQMFGKEKHWAITYLDGDSAELFLSSRVTYDL